MKKSSLNTVMAKLLSITMLLLSWAHQSIQHSIPVRHYDSETPVDASTWNNVTIGMWAHIDQTTMTTMTVSDLLSKNIGQACYHLEPIPYANADTSIPGKHHRLVFNNGHITRFTVLSPYNPLKHSVKTFVHTKWPSMTEGNYTDLVKAVKENTVFNITFSSTAEDYGSKSANKCSVAEAYVVPDEWCSTVETFHQSMIKVKPFVDSDGVCKIPFSAQIDHYIDMWKANTLSNDNFKKRCLGDPDEGISFADYMSSNLKDMYPTFFQCHKIYGKNLPNCTDNYNQNYIYTNALAIVSQLQVGRNNQSIDINMTVEWKLWTMEFPDMFGNTFKYCGFDSSRTNMTIDIYTIDPIIVPVRGIPLHFWVIVGVSAPAAFILLTTVIFIICSRSRKGLMTDVWEYNREKKQIHDRELQRKFDRTMKHQEMLAMKIMESLSDPNPEPKI